MRFLAPGEVQISILKWDMYVALVWDLEWVLSFISFCFFVFGFASMEVWVPVVPLGLCIVMGSMPGFVDVREIRPPAAVLVGSRFLCARFLCGLSRFRNRSNFFL